jgi:hypothetical protein
MASTAARVAVIERTLMGHLLSRRSANDLRKHPLPIISSEMFGNNYK